jgi:hypothetical protein
MTFLIFVTISSVMDTDGRPEWGSLSAEVRPSLKRFHYSYVSVQPKASLPNAVFNILNVSVKDFPNLTKKFTQIRCSWK